MSIGSGGACDVITTCSCEGIVLGEVSAPGAPNALIVSPAAGPGSLVDLSFQRNGATNYNVYVSTDPGTFPFLVNAPSAGKKSCDVPFNSQLGGKGLILGYDVEAGITGGAGAFYILISGDDGPATEGSLGSSSAGTDDRTAESLCAD